MEQNYDDKKEKLNKVLEVASQIIDQNDNKDVRKHPIYSLIKSMVKYHLYDIVRALYEGDVVPYVDSLYNNVGAYLLNSDILKNIKIYNERESGIDIDLAKNAVLVCAWNRERFVDAVLNIGENGGKSFEYDKINHRSAYIYPIGLTIVYNGNHSILSGILNGEGFIRANETYDLMPTYEYMYFDGMYFRTKNGDRILYKVDRFELGALYEIGRILTNNNIR